MPDYAIKIDNLGKKYIIGHQNQAGYKTFRDALVEKVKAAANLLRHPFSDGANFSSSDYEEFWAIRDICLEIKAGERVGIIGRNGAGKSTLLKILSRITDPSAGDIRINGRVASLLEVGTGFHPELTGRENIYLNGAILGMGREEIKRKFDEIVSFSEVEKFLDTPVKRYSSGMYVRLAFAVAAHLEPEILIVDEVLAVGDAAFQKKCLGKMEDVGKSGRTVLFVSHNMGAIMRLCEKAALMDNGRLLKYAMAEDTVADYLKSGVGSPALREWEENEAPGNEIASLLSVAVIDESNEIKSSAAINKKIIIRMKFLVKLSGYVLTPNFHFYNGEGVCAFVVSEVKGEWKRKARPAGYYITEVEVPPNFLSEGTYLVGAALSTMSPLNVHFFERDAVSFQVADNDSGETARGDYSGPIPGVLRPILNWKTIFEDKYKPAV